jgi:predicted RNase H-like nuclease
MQRTTMQVGGKSYLLAQGQNVDDVQQAAVDAAKQGAGVVKVTVLGNRELGIVVTPGVPIIFESEIVPDEARDDGNLGAPFEVPILDSYFDA